MKNLIAKILCSTAVLSATIIPATGAISNATSLYVLNGSKSVLLDYEHSDNPLYDFGGYVSIDQFLDKVFDADNLTLQINTPTIPTVSFFDGTKNREFKPNLYATINYTYLNGSAKQVNEPLTGLLTLGMIGVGLKSLRNKRTFS